MYYITIGDPENQILREIEEGHTRRSIALTYAFCIRDHQSVVDWGRINKAIIKRWSKSGLQFIKRMAWKLIDEQMSKSNDECK